MKADDLPLWGTLSNQLLETSVVKVENPSVEVAAHPHSDYAIAAKVIAGERERFQLLVVRYRDMIFAMIMRQVRDRSLAEELAQETFIKAYKALAQFQGGSSFGTWITRIALNHTNSYFVSRRYKEQVRVEAFEPERHEQAIAAMSSNDVEECRQKEDRLTAFSQALGGLKGIYRDVITLCALEGRSYEEAASILEIPVGTVRSRLNKARLELRDAIAELMPQERV